MGALWRRDSTLGTVRGEGSAAIWRMVPVGSRRLASGLRRVATVSVGRRRWTNRARCRVAVRAGCTRRGYVVVVRGGAEPGGVRFRARALIIFLFSRDCVSSRCVDRLSVLPRTAWLGCDEDRDSYIWSWLIRLKGGLSLLSEYVLPPLS